MSIVYDYVRPGRRVMDGPHSSAVLVTVFFPEDGRSEVTMAKQSPPQPWQRNLLPEEDTAHFGRDIGEGISHTPDDKIFKRRGLLNEHWPFLLFQPVALVEEGERQLKDCVLNLSRVSWFRSDNGFVLVGSVPKNGSTCSTVITVSNRPTLSMSCGARKMQNTMQSRYDTGPRIIFLR